MHLAVANNPSTIDVSSRTSVVVEGPLQGYTGYKFSLNIQMALKFENKSIVWNKTFSLTQHIMHHSVIVFLISLHICETYLGSDRQTSMSDFEEDYKLKTTISHVDSITELSVCISLCGYTCGNQAKLETYAVSYYL